MKESLHGYDFDVRTNFPNAREFQSWCGGCAYLAERDGVPYVIVDEGTMADFLGADDGDLLDKLVRVLEFQSDAERAAYVRRRLAGAAGVFFSPWVGDGYAASANRLLVLGESHYAREPQDGAFTQRLTQGYVDGRMKHRFWTLVARTIADKHLERTGCGSLWRSVVFYNFIQQIVGASSRVRPKPDMWKAAHRPFLHVLQEHDPHAVLVLGKNLWSNLPSAEHGDSILRKDGSAWPTKVYEGRDSSRVIATFISHPASRGFSPRNWRDVVAGLRAQTQAL